MARYIWKGSLQFGLVSIPVSLAPAEEPTRTVSFDLIDRRDHSRIGYEKVNKTTGEPVDKEDIVKGYKFEGDEYVVFTEDELKKVRTPGTQTVEILSFLDPKEINWMYFEKPYYLVPEKKQFKTYALLREVLRRSGRVGVASIVIHFRQHLAFVAAQEEALILEILRFPAEIRARDEFDFPDTNLKKIGITAKEVDMAEKLVDQMVEEWNPSLVNDSYYDDVMKLIEQKAKRGRIEVVGDEKRKRTSDSNIVSLLPLLKKSMREKAETRKSTKRPARRSSRSATRLKRSGT